MATGGCAWKRCPTTPAYSRRRRRPAHPRPAGALSVRERLSRHDRHRCRQRARASMRGLAFDVVILDVMMPGESGLELARDLKAHLQHPDLHADRAGRARAAHRGARDRRRRLCRQAVRAARAAAAAAEHPQARPAARPGRATRSRMGDFTFHVGRGELKRKDETIKLTERERDLLRLFAPAPGNADRPPRAGRRRIRPAASAPSTCRSTGCAARSKPIRPIPSTCRPCAAKATYSTPTERAGRDGLAETTHARSQPTLARKLAPAPRRDELAADGAGRASPAHCSASWRRRGSTPARSSSSSRRSCCWKAWSPSPSWSATGTR